VFFFFLHKKTVENANERLQLSVASFNHEQADSICSINRHKGIVSQTFIALSQ